MMNKKSYCKKLKQEESFFACRQYYVVLFIQTMRFGRVSKGISAQASHRTVLDSLPSHGSCYTNLILALVISKFPMVK